VRTAADFDGVYAKPDPWGVAQEPRRDRTLARIIAPYVEGKTVLDLGCGEGHLTAAVFQSAAWVTAIDISQVAIQRTPRLANARFAATDFMSPDVSFEGQDVITALECLYYLSPEELEAFFRHARHVGHAPSSALTAGERPAPSPMHLRRVSRTRKSVVATQVADWPTRAAISSTAMPL